VSIDLLPASPYSSLQDGWWMYALQEQNGERHLVFNGHDAMEAAQFRASAPGLTINRVTGWQYAARSILAVRKATRIWGPNLILDVSCSTADGARRDIRIAGPRKALKELFAYLGHPV